MITSNVLQRVFHIRYGNITASAFTLDVDHKQYIVTANHAIPNLDGRGIVQVNFKRAWTDLNVEVVGAGSPDEPSNDVIVLAADRLISPLHELPATSKSIFYGQDVYFLGFPYGLGTNLTINNGYPLPFVKRAIWSGSMGELSNGDNELFVLDGLNNPGFSGGPVVFKPNNQTPYTVMGVVSGFRTEYNDVFQAENITGLKALSNTGLVLAPSIARVLDIIKANPIGVDVTSLSA